MNSALVCKLRGSLAVGALALSLLTIGCGNMVTTDTSVYSVEAASLSGRIQGGNQPISSATVKLYTLGTTGYGSAGTLLATTSTGTDGSFGFIQRVSGTFDGTSSNYVCPASTTQTYIVVNGGSTQGNGNGTNTAAAFITALGQCSASANSTVFINEVTTVATVAALQQYLNPGTTPGTERLGVPNPATRPQALAGYAVGQQTIANLVSTTTGVANTSTTASATPANATSAITVTITPETAKINTIADIASSCVNSTTGATQDSQGNATNCGTLFTNAVPPSPAVTSQPGATFSTAQDTLQATYYMLTNPVDGGGSALGNLFGLVAASGAPFQTALSAAPTDWTIGVTYSAPTSTTACTSGANFLQDVQDVTVDGSGNIWITNGFGAGAGLSSITPTGTPRVCSDIAYNGSYRSAIDINGYIWTTDNNDSNINKFDPTTNTTTVLPSTGVVKSYAIAADGSGNVFFTDTTQSRLFELPSTATASTVATNLGPVVPNQSPYVVAVDTKGTVIVDQAGSSGNTITAFTKTTAAGTAYNPPVSLTQPTAYAGVYGVAFDQNGSFWVGNSAGTSLSASTGPGNTTSSTPVTYTTDGSGNLVTTFGTPTHISSIFAGGLNAARMIAVDGANNIWYANTATTSVGTGTLYSVSEFTNAGVPISPTKITSGTGSSGTGSTTNGGFQKAQTVFKAPLGLAIDATGNVWVSNVYSAITTNWITEIVGAAVPVVTPLSIAIKNNQLGQQP